MSLAKVGRKIKRTGKEAVQFRFTSTFEYIDLECIGSWRPSLLKVIWQRSHRRVETIGVKWIPVADRGPDGATGRAPFDQPLSIALIVTLYRDAKKTDFEEKEYKYYIEHEGPSGKKILATFYMNLGAYAGIPNSKSVLELLCKPVSKKVRKAQIGCTLESEFIKEGKEGDEDMQSTYSSISAIAEDVPFDEEDEEEGAEVEQSPASVKEAVVKTGFSFSDGSNLSPKSDSSESVTQNQIRAVPDLDPLVRDMEPISPTVSVSIESRDPLNDWIPTSTKFLNADGKDLPAAIHSSTKVIGLYFTAQWCPPCKKFMPKLIKFYELLKQKDCQFDLLYVSSDHSQADMMNYVKSQSVSFPIISYGDLAIENLRKKFDIHTIPTILISDRTGKLIDMEAKKAIEKATSESSAMKCYQSWLEGQPAKKEKKGILNSLAGFGKNSDTLPVSTPEREITEAPKKQELVDNEFERAKIETKARTKSTAAGYEKEALIIQLKEKDEQIRNLEITNEALQQTITDLKEANTLLKDKNLQLEEAFQNAKSEKSSLLKEKEELLTHSSLCGWLFKRGVKGITGKKWRRRYFKTDKAKLYYYKEANDSIPQGFIDLATVRDVHPAPEDFQDKTGSTFYIISEGRTYEILAMNPNQMNEWIKSVKYVAHWHKQNRQSDN